MKKSVIVNETKDRYRNERLDKRAKKDSFKNKLKKPFDAAY